jgi:hypothetical protein
VSSIHPFLPALPPFLFIEIFCSNLLQAHAIISLAAFVNMPIPAKPPALCLLVAMLTLRQVEQ